MVLLAPFLHRAASVLPSGNDQGAQNCQWSYQGGPYHNVNDLPENICRNTPLQDTACPMMRCPSEGVIKNQLELAIDYLYSEAHEFLVITKEQYPEDRKDHWGIGSADSDIYRGGSLGLSVSGCLGSMALPIKFQKNFPGNYACASPGSPSIADCQRIQLAVGSEHSGDYQRVRCGGSVDFISNDVDANIRADMVTQASQVNAEFTAPMSTRPNP